MATYPLLPVACDIDREVGQLIRLVVALTDRDAMSCEGYGRSTGGGQPSD